MANYTYTGPTQSLSLKTGTRKEGKKEVSVYKDFILVEGKPVTLPDGHEIVTNLEAAGFLSDPPAAKTPKSKTAPKTGDKTDG